MSDTIKIVLADDEELFRKGIYFLLQREKNIEVVFEASNGSEVIDYLKKCDVLPDIVLMDLKMPGINGVEATKIIHKEFSDVKIIALTSYNTKSFIANMIHVGAVSYLVKSASPSEMIQTINEVAIKGFYYNDIVLQVIEDNILSNSDLNKSSLDSEILTNREREVLTMICQQLNANEIADKLCISARTVEGHRTKLMLKTGSKNIAGLVVYAIQNKLLLTDEF